MSLEMCFQPRHVMEEWMQNPPDEKKPGKRKFEDFDMARFVSVSLLLWTVMNVLEYHYFNREDPARVIVVGGFGSPGKYNISSLLTKSLIMYLNLVVMSVAAFFGMWVAIKAKPSYRATLAAVVYAYVGPTFILMTVAWACCTFQPTKGDGVCAAEPFVSDERKEFMEALLGYIKAPKLVLWAHNICLFYMARTLAAVCKTQFWRPTLAVFLAVMAGPMLLSGVAFLAEPLGKKDVTSAKAIQPALQSPSSEEGAEQSRRVVSFPRNSSSH